MIIHIKHIKRLFFFISLVSGLLIISSCTTKRKGIIFRNYHALNARDNGYFNAKLKVIDAEQTLREGHIDRYDRILNVFQYGDDDLAKSVFSPMDDAIKKVSISIEDHSILLKGIEYNIWIDDCYMLMGEAQFYKHDYSTALETFQYVSSTYKKNPRRYEAILWMLNCNIELKKDEATETLIDFIKNDSKFPKKLIGRYSAMVAEYNIRKKNYSAAAKSLTKAIALTRKRTSKTRYTFILAQLYQKMRDYPRAFRLYGKVVKSNASYDMEFNARMNRAICFDALGSDTKAIKKELLKMLKEEKNKDYFDQINFALAEIVLKEGDTEGAINYLKESIRTSTSNTSQKALSYLELAEIYFRKPEYINAQAYYDSSVSILAKDHPDYSSILNKRNSLSKLVKQLKIIAYEDSVQKVAQMSPAQREKFINDLILKEAREEQRKKEEAEAAKFQNNSSVPQNQQSRPGFTEPGGSQWYFYNPSAIGFGYTEFVRKWGQRKLEDHWRRSNKNNEQDPDATDEESTEDVAKKNEKEGSKKSKDDYLKNLPLSDKAIAESNERITEAYYTLGLIYKEQLFDNEEAIKTFEELIKRFPKNKYLPQTYYQLYRINLAIGNKEKAEYYKNLLFNNFPNSDYTRLIKDPSFADELKSSSSKLNSYYEETYKLYTLKNYAEARNRISQAESMFPQNELQPKFTYLDALCVGRTSGIDEFKNALINVIKKYPEDPVKKSAQETLDLILRNLSLNNFKSNQPKYIFNADTSHIYILAIPVNFDANKLKISISNHNSTYFANQVFDISAIIFDANYQFISVKDFPDAKTAKSYLNEMQKLDALNTLKPSDYKHFIISSSNFIIMLNSKKTDDYLEFFNSYYK